MTDNMKIPITSPQEQVLLKIAEEMNIRDVQEFKFAFAIVSKVMAMYKDDDSEELLEQIQDLTETEDEDFRCSTCDHINDLIKNR